MLESSRLSAAPHSAHLLCWLASISALSLGPLMAEPNSTPAAQHGFGPRAAKGYSWTDGRTGGWGSRGPRIRRWDPVGRDGFGEVIAAECQICEPRHHGDDFGRNDTGQGVVVEPQPLQGREVVTTLKRAEYVAAFDRDVLGAG